MPHIHNAIHRFTQLLDAYRRAVGEDLAEFSGIERAGETLTPVLDLWRNPEWAILRRELHFSSFVNTNTAAAGRFAAVALTNPAASGKIVTVRRVLTCSSPNWDCGVDSTTGASILANLVTQEARPLDTRHNAGGVLRPNSALLQHGDVGAVFGLQAAFHSEDIQEQPSPWFVIAPGMAWIAIGSTAATDVQLNIWWTERQALSGELG